MKTTFRLWPFAILALCLSFSSLAASQLQLVSTESDPDAFIQNSVNVINGDYCESATDLVIAGPDALMLQRFYSSKNIITGSQPGGWRHFPQRFLVIGKIDQAIVRYRNRTTQRGVSFYRRTFRWNPPIQWLEK